MIVLCGLCGADLADSECGCRREREAAPRSRFLEACLTALATSGRVDKHSLAEAGRVLREEPS